MPPTDQPLRPADAGLPDDVDRVLARLTQLPPPRDFTATVLLAIQRAQAYQLGPQQIAWAVADVAAVVILAILAFVAGQAFVGGGTLALLRAVASDAEVLQLLPSETLLALLASFPWLELAGVAIMVAAVATCTRHLGRVLAEPSAARGGVV